MKKSLLLLVFGTLLFALVACGDSEPSGPPVFTFATWAAGPELTELRAVVAKVNERAAGEFTIQINSIPSNYYQQIAVLIGGRQAPDMFWLTQELIPKYAFDLKTIVDVTDSLTNSEVLPLDAYYEGVIESAYYNGSYWGLPWIANPIIIYYNKTLFDNAGIPHPSPTDDWDWNEFIAISEQLTGTLNHRGEKVFGTVIDGWPNIETFIWAGGGDIIAEDYQTITLDSAGSLAGLGLLQSILEKGLSPSYSEVRSLGGNNVWFERSRVAMFMGGAQDNFEIKVDAMNEADAFEIGYAPLPVNLDGSRSSFNWTASTVLHKSHQDNPLAYKALEMLTLAIFEWKIAPPVRGSIENIRSINPSKIAAMETIEFTLEFARSGFYIPEWDGISGINHRLWYDLYFEMIQNPNFDYLTAVDDIAAFSRNLIDQRP